MEALGSDLMKAALAMGTAGPFVGFLLYLWRDERTERRSIQTAYNQLLQQTIESRHVLATALEKLADKIKA